MRNKALFIVVCLWPLMSLLHAQANYSLDFSGSDKYVEVPNSSDFSFGEGQDFTVSTWFKTDDSYTGLHALVAQARNVSPNVGWQLGFTHDYSGSIIFHITDGADQSIYLWGKKTVHLRTIIGIMLL